MLKVREPVKKIKKCGIFHISLIVYLEICCQLQVWCKYDVYWSGCQGVAVGSGAGHRKEG